jgi:tetratricopeptide (TPR) repeat protein
VATTEAELRRAVELDGEFLLAYQRLAELYYNTNQPDRAVAEYRKITDRKPQDAVTFSKIGMVEFSRQNLDAAADSYRRALAVNPNEDVAANNLAMLYAEHERGNIDEAVRLAQEVVRRNPEVAGYADTLGWTYYKKGLYGPAAEQLQKAVTLSAKAGGDNSVYRYHYGLALAGKGDRAGARREFQAALRLAEREAAAPNGRAKTPVEEIQRAMNSL